MSIGLRKFSLEFNKKISEVNMFANILKTLRIENKLSQEELAKKIGSNQRQISKWENGIIEPNINQLKAIADEFQISTDYLIGRSDDSGIINTNANLAPMENDVLTLFRKLSKQDQFKALGFLQALAS